MTKAQEKQEKKSKNTLAFRGKKIQLIAAFVHL